MPSLCTSSEVNLLIYHYLKESGFHHACFSLRHESRLDDEPLSHEAVVEPGHLIRILQKGLLYLAVEAHVNPDGTEKACSAPFRLVGPPHVCDGRPRPPPSQSPPRLTPSPPPVRPVLRESGAQTVPVQLVAPRPVLATAEPRRLVNGIHAASSRSDLEDRSSKVATSSKNKLDSTSPCSESEVTGGEAAAGSSSAAEAVQAKQSKDAKRKALSSSISGLVGREEKRSRREGEEGSHSRTENGKVASQERVRERDLAVASAEEDEDEDGLRTRNEKGASGTSAPLSPTSAKVRPKARDTVSASADSAPNSKGKTDKERDRIREGAAKKKKKVVATSGSAVGSNGSGKTSSRTGVVGSLPKETKNNRPTIQTSGMATAAFDAKAPQPLLSAKAKGKEVANDDIVELRGHSAEVFVSAWNPTVPGLLASGSGDATVRIWDLPKQKGESIDSPAVCKHLPPTHAKDISTLDWNPDGTLLASGSYDGIARLWTPQGDLHLVMSMHQGPIFGVRWNRKGTMLLTGSSDGTAIVWDLSSGKVRQQFSVHTDSVLDVDWLTSGKSDMMATSAMDATFATCSADNTVNICRLGHAQPLRSFKGHSDEVNAVRFDPSQTLLVSVSDDMTAKIWALDQTILGGSTGDAGSRKRTAFKSRGGSAADEYSSNMDVDRSEDEQEAADMAKMEGSKGKGCKFTLSGHTKELYAVAWCPTGPGSANPDQPRMLATTSFDRTARLWNADNGTCLREMREHSDSVYSLCFSPDARFMATGGIDHRVFITRVEDGAIVKQYTGGGGIFDVAWHSEPLRGQSSNSSSNESNNNHNNSEANTKDEDNKSVVRASSSSTLRFKSHYLAVSQANRTVAVLDLSNLVDEPGTGLGKKAR